MIIEEKIHENNESKTEQIAFIKAKGFATTKEASLYLGLSIHYIRRLARDNLIEFTRPSGKCIYFSIDSLENYVSKNKRICNDTINQKSANFIFKSKNQHR